jgi:hypothetical protein
MSDSSPSPNRPFVAITEFASINEGYAAVARADAPFPFVVRASADFDATATLMLSVRSQIRREQCVKGYTGYPSRTLSATGRDALAQFDMQTLGYIAHVRMRVPQQLHL